MVELVIAIVIAGVMLGGMMAVWVVAVGRSADPIIMRQAQVLAHGFITEIAVQPLHDPSSGELCPAPPRDRAQFDNVCDYDGFEADTVLDPAGTPLDGFHGYRLYVAVKPSAWSGLPERDVLRIEVTVDTPIGQPVRLVTYRTCHEEGCHAQ